VRPIYHTGALQICTKRVNGNTRKMVRPRVSRAHSSGRMALSEKLAAATDAAAECAPDPLIDGLER
jgi:hypothetical protein